MSETYDYSVRIYSPDVTPEQVEQMAQAFGDHLAMYTVGRESHSFEFDDVTEPDTINPYLELRAEDVGTGGLAEREVYVWSTSARRVEKASDTFVTALDRILPADVDVEVWQSATYDSPEPRLYQRYGGWSRTVSCFDNDPAISEARVLAAVEASTIDALLEEMRHFAHRTTNGTTTDTKGA